MMRMSTLCLHRRNPMRILLSCLLTLALAVVVHADQGNPKLTKIDSIAFGPNGLLLIGGDARRVTIETSDTKTTDWAKAEVAKIDQLLAGKLGLETKYIEIRKLAVNPVPKKAYIAVHSLKT